MKKDINLNKNPFSKRKKSSALKPFDLLLRFNESLEKPEVVLGSDTVLVLEGLIKQFGRINVLVDWFGDGVTIHVPTEYVPLQNAPQGTSEPPGSTEKSE